MKDNQTLFTKHLPVPGDKSRRVPTGREAYHIVDHMQKWEQIVFISFLAIAILSVVTLVYKTSHKFMTKVPASGGSFTEGFVGSPLHINPVIARSTTVDSDLVMLTHSGLLRRDKFGEFIPDLAENYIISEDGLEYTFTLRDNLEWHDGEELTIEDVLYTINLIKNEDYKSPRIRNFDGVQVIPTGDREIKFILEEAYSPFLAAMTVGILPKHIWENVSVEQFGFDEHNLDKVVGSGPYKIKKVIRGGSSVSSIIFEPFKNFVFGSPYLKRVKVNFYTDEDALLSDILAGKVDSAGSLSTGVAKDLQGSDHKLIQTPLPKVYAAFFNQDKNELLPNSNIREILDGTVDKHRIIEEALRGFGRALDGPLPDNYLMAPSDTTNKTNRAISLLEDGGWKLGEDGVRTKKKERLSFTISTFNIPELTQVASILKKNWEDIGAEVNIKTYDATDIKQNIVPERDYDILLSGQGYQEIIDPSPLWHSRFRLHPGLNVALYTSVDADRILDQLRVEYNIEKRITLMNEFSNRIRKDKPAIFLYVPDYIYLPAKDIRGIDLSNISNKSERYNEVYKWHSTQESVWKLFNY